jgi:hypothetical protein
MSSPAPAVRPVKPAAPPRSAAVANPTERRQLQIRRGVQDAAQRVVIFGSGGSGKTSLAATISQIDIEPFFVDIENGTNFLDVARLDPVPETWEELLDGIRILSDEPTCKAIVLDSLTRAEELAIAYTLRTVPHEKGNLVKSVEGYGFGKGYTHVYETFLTLLQALDAAARKGKHVIATCHECTANVPNPTGEDFLRYEPRLQSPPSGKGSIRHRVKEWCDHLLFICFDVHVDNEGKAKGSGTRTIYPNEMPTHWAKSRSISGEIPYYLNDATVWKKLFGKEN